MARGNSFRARVLLRLFARFFDLMLAYLAPISSLHLERLRVQPAIQENIQMSLMHHTALCVLLVNIQLYSELQIFLFVNRVCPEHFPAVTDHNLANIV